MTTFPEDLQIIEINPEKDEQELVALYEDELDKKLQPAQSERIQVSIVNKIATNMKIKFNAAIKNLFLPYAKGIFLDIIGALLGCPRLTASQAVSVILVTLYEIYSFDKVLPKGTEIETSDGEYVFTTDEDLIIPAGSKTGQVHITSEKAGSVLNYKQGEINTLIKNYEYVESVKNISDAEGGSDEEKDDPYRERLMIAAEKSSTAGARLAYKYFAMSADKTITDVEVECKQEDASIEYDNEVFTEVKGVIDNDKINAIIDYFTGTMTVTLKEYGDKVIKITIPPCARVDIYVLTSNGAPSNEIRQKIYEAVNTDERRPLNDFVVVNGATEAKFKIKANVLITNDADSDTVLKLINSGLTDYINNLRLKLKQAVYPSEIIRIIKSISGVAHVELESPNVLPADIKTFYVGEIDEIKMTRVK